LSDQLLTIASAEFVIDFHQEPKYERRLLHRVPK
jgi:hypothetical protein